ncbi:MFS transporter [Cellulosilyticum sp. I15G10I2]|uniref:MFS transporter n=1 Tax=Cellulosilyticum sp. I15G10I2 TaxID=1892843 RepID=UPI00085CDBB1|nr:MFS transporter [Cellulosilyticum sp. I15G10I2]
MNKMLFMIATSFFWFSLYAYVPELSTYAKDLGASYQIIGVITGAYGFTQMLLRIPLGILSDRLNRRKIFIQIGMLATIVSALITFFFPSVFSLLVTRLLAGVAASTWVTFTVLFASYYKHEESPKAIGIMNSYNAVGQIIAMVLGGIISLQFGTRSLYLLGAIGGIAGFILSFMIRENKEIELVPVHIKELFLIAADTTLVKVSVLAILSQLITFATTFGFVPIVAQQLGANSMQLGLLTAIGNIPGIWIPTLAGTMLVHLWGQTKTLVYGFMLSALLCMITPFISSLWILMGAQLLVGTGRGMVFPLLMGLSIKNIEASKRATAMGIFQAVYGVGMIIGPIILGTIAGEFGLTTGFIVTGFIGIAASLLTIRFKIV